MISAKLFRAAVATATILTLGAPSAFAAKIQKAHVKAKSATTVVSVQGSSAKNKTNVDQDGGFFTNQNAKVNNTASSTVKSDIDATSGNIIVIDQD